MLENELFEAVQSGDLELTETLLTQNANPNSQHKYPLPGSNFTYDELSPLHAACHSGHYELVETLLKHGADVNAKTKRYTVTPLQLACAGNEVVGPAQFLVPNRNVIRRNHSNVVELLLKYGAHTKGNSPFMYPSPLHLACQEGAYHIAKLLLEKESDIELKQTALHVACKYAQLKIVTLLLDHKVNIEATDSQGLTPLHLCIEEFKVIGEEKYQTIASIIVILLKHRAKAEKLSLQKIIDILIHDKETKGHLPLARWLLTCSHSASQKEIENLLEKAAKEDFNAKKLWEVEKVDLTNLLSWPDLSSSFSLLTDNKIVKQLTLENRKYGSNEPIALFEALTNNVTLEILDLSRWNFNNKAYQALLNMLKKNITLKVLRLNNCQLTDDKIIALANALKGNQETKLQLDLSNNPKINVRSAEALADLLSIHPYLPIPHIIGCIGITAFWHQLFSEIIAKRPNLPGNFDVQEVAIEEKIESSDNNHDIEEQAAVEIQSEEKNNELLEPNQIFNEEDMLSEPDQVYDEENESAELNPAYDKIDPTVSSQPIALPPALQGPAEKKPLMIEESEMASAEQLMEKKNQEIEALKALIKEQKTTQETLSEQNERLDKLEKEYNTWLPYFEEKRKRFEAQIQIQTEGKNCSLYYEMMYIRLENMLSGAKTIASGFVHPVNSSNGKAAMAVSSGASSIEAARKTAKGTIEIILSFIPPIEKAVEIAAEIAEAIDEKRQFNLLRNIGELNTLKDVSKIAEYVARMLTWRYIKQLKQIKTADQSSQRKVSSFEAFMRRGSKINEAIKEFILKEKPLTTVDSLIAFALLRMFGAMQDGLIKPKRDLPDSVELCYKIIAEQLLSIITKELSFTEKLIEDICEGLKAHTLETRNGQKWTITGFYFQPAVAVLNENGQYDLYEGKIGHYQTDVKNYGCRLGSIEEVNQCALKIIKAHENKNTGSTKIILAATIDQQAKIASNSNSNANKPTTLSKNKRGSVPENKQDENIIEWQPKAHGIILDNQGQMLNELEKNIYVQNTAIEVLEKKNKEQRDQIDILKKINKTLSDEVTTLKRNLAVTAQATNINPNQSTMSDNAEEKGTQSNLSMKNTR